MQSLSILVHTIFEELDTEVADILPAMHAIGGCETTKNIGIKAPERQAGIEEGQKLLYYFGRDDLLENMIPMAEYFFTKFISYATEFQTFDELRHHVYHVKNFQLDIKKLSCTFTAICLHIHRAYLQCYLCTHRLLSRSH